MLRKETQVSTRMIMMTYEAQGTPGVGRDW